MRGKVLEGELYLSFFVEASLGRLLQMCCVECQKAKLEANPPKDAFPLSLSQQINPILL